jgi:type VI secretion system protein ImpK
MPDPDDPFGFDQDDSAGRTVVKPMPGGMPGQFRRPLVGGEESAHRPLERPAEFAGQTPWPLGGEGGLSPIERAAASLIALLSKLAGSASHPDPAGLRERVIQEVHVFENNARRAGVSPEDLYVARYVLCTAIDEAVLNTPWGAASNWDMQSLLVTFHKEAKGGVRFFQLLGELSQDPRRHLHLLELMYILLALGFQGRYRHADNGRQQLERLREQLYRDIRQQRGDYERALSPHWKGEQRDYRPLTQYVPWWVILAGFAAFLLLVYMVLSFRLGDEATPAYAAIADIGVEQMPRRVAALPPAPLPVVDSPAPEKRLADLLADAIEQERLTVDEDALQAKIRIRGDGLFRSGRDQVQPGVVPLLEDIAKALDEFSGKVLISGHTDNIPIRTLKFPSNWHLSEARARSVQKLMSAVAADATRYEAEGRGEREPLVPNVNKANRAQNRRVEITLFKHAATGSGT